MDGLSRFAPRADQAPQTPVMRRHIDHPSAWKVADFRPPVDYSIDLSAAQLADINSSAKAVRAAGLGLADIERKHFPLPTMADTIAAIRREIIDGRGFVVLRGLPVDAFSKDEIGFLYWGIGTHLGIGQAQSVMGDRLGHVKDLSREDPNARAYRNKQELSPHTDLSDLVSLCCLRSAPSGGVSRLASALTIHNIILAERPQYLDRLYRGYIEAGMAEVGSPIDDLDREILDFVEATSKRPDVMLEFTLAPGEMYFLNNYTILHARTSFDDHEEEDRRRHLLRLWLEVPDMRPTHPHINLFEGKGIAAVAGRTPTYDWRGLTAPRG